jgi:hypothetical protein
MFPKILGTDYPVTQRHTPEGSPRVYFSFLYASVNAFKILAGICGDTDKESNSVLGK